MRSIWFAVKIAGIFFVVMGAFVIVTLNLFARVVMRHRHHGVGVMEAHDTFIMTVLVLALFAMALMIGLAWWVTRPLRDMSRSMDRIAAGDLDHRVDVHGRDEAATMGRSFNKMADRVRGMVDGQKELVAGVSHELRSPLARMKMALELMRREGSTEARLNGLEEEIDEVDGLVEELLLSSRIDLGAAQLKHQPCSLSTVIDRAWAQRGSQTLSLETTLGEGATEVLGDAALLTRVFGNIFENSARYAEQGVVAVRSRVESQRVVLTISDSGPGVPDADLAAIFDPFYRVDSSRSRKTGASGLGLMIVKRAIEAHGGQVRAYRDEQQRFTIEFDLPPAAV